MPIISKYSAEQQDKLFHQLLETLTQEPIQTDMALMVLGNLVSHTINQAGTKERRAELAKKFGHILLQTVQTD